MPRFLKWQDSIQISVLTRCSAIISVTLQKRHFPLPPQWQRKNHMLGGTSRPKSSLAKTSQSCRHHSEKFLCCFSLNAPSNLHHAGCFLKFSVSHQSHWMKLQPLAASPGSERYCRSRWPLSLWQAASHLTPVSFTSAPGPMGHWFECMRELGLTWHVYKWDRVRSTEWEKCLCLTTPTTDQ